jgi:dolichyl-phosphate-mannose--protein O-mannosyl transferase
MLYWGVAALVLVGFVYFSPFTFGWTLSERSYDARFWVLHPQL